MQALVKELFSIDIDVPCFTDEQLEILYRAARGFYQGGEYQKGVDFFTSLVLHNPFEERFWKGLGASHQMLRQYKEALAAWGAFCKVAEVASEGFFHAAECFVSLGLYEDAKRALNRVKNDR